MQLKKSFLLIIFIVANAPPPPLATGNGNWANARTPTPKAPAVSGAVSPARDKSPYQPRPGVTPSGKRHGH